MTKHIFDYISIILLEHFKNAHIDVGSRFHIRYEHDDQVKSQYETLRSMANSNSYLVSLFEFNDYSSYRIQYENYNLIIAANIDGVEADFLTGLRNRVEEFDQAAILFIHNTSLDSIIGGCKSLSESEMPLNSGVVKKNIQTQIGETSYFKSFEKKILEYRLEKIEDGEDDGYSLFNYSIFLEILGKKELSPNDFKELGLFKDIGLENEYSGEIKKRLAQNEEWFDEISNGHQYGNLDKILEKTFSERGVRSLNGEDWYSKDFTELIIWSDEKDKVENIKYLENQAALTDDKLVFWDKADGSTPVKARNRNIIIFNHERLNHINFGLYFDGKPKNKGINYASYPSQNIVNSDFKISGNQILTSLELEQPDQPSYRSFIYEHPETFTKHTFNLLVLPFNAELIESLKASYYLKYKSKNWYLEIAIEEPIILNKGYDARYSDVIRNGECYHILENQTLQLGLSEEWNDLDQEEINFELVYKDFKIPFKLAVESDKPKYISGITVWQLKQQAKLSLKYLTWEDPKKKKDIVSLTHGANKYYPVDAFRENLRHEYEIITTGHLAYLEVISGKLIPEDDILIDDELLQAYKNLINYFKENDLLPSLAALDKELIELSSQFVQLFIKQLSSLEEGKPLSKREMDLFKIGTVEMRYGDKLLKFTPLHPLNLAYQLRLEDEPGRNNMAAYLLDKLRPLNLIPYIKGKKKQNSDANYFYQPIEQNHSAEWQYFFCDEISSQQISRYFVPELVSEKIRQFLKHFRYLFIKEQTVLKINLFNQGDAKEILVGIFHFYAQYFRKDLSNPDEAISIQVTIYGSKNYMTKFEEVTMCDDVSLIEKTFDLKFPNVAEPDELYDLYSRKVTFFKIDKALTYNYAHLSFYQFSPAEVKKSSSIMSEVPTGISLDGLMADVPSIFQKDSFRTGFGSANLIEANPLLELATLMNAYVNVTHTEDQYNASNAIAFVISKNADSVIENICDKSQWITFIEPKVDLGFFKSYKDVVIIHYSDQYNNASGYDAITITSKWGPYRDTIKEVFEQQQIVVSEQAIIKVIDLFNAINGHWLLMLNNHYKTGSNFRMEKLSLLSAVKAALAVLHHESITWVPISMEEILRVSGAVGLKQSEGLFSVKNLGKDGMHGDDLLMLGLEMKGETLYIHFYPMEVKIGNVDSATYDKAKGQSKYTAELIRDFLIDNKGLSGKIYRNFFAKLILIGAEKCVLYEIWPSYSNRWREIQNYRNKLLQDNFIVSTHLDMYIGAYGVILFKSSSEFLSRSLNYEDDGCIVTMLKSDGLDYLNRDLEELTNMLHSGGIHAIIPNQLLFNKYNRVDEDKIDLQIEEIVKIPEIIPAVNDSLIINEARHIDALVFDRLTRADIELSYMAIYEKLSAIGIEIKKDLLSDINFIEGPAFYRIEIKPAPTTTIKKIKSAVEELNIALHLREEDSVRIFSDLGKIWLEAPKKDDKKIMVTTQHIWPAFEKTAEFKVPFGTDINGIVQSVNFSSSNSPHLLLAGTTGSGKSVVLDTLIRGAANFYTPEELQIFLIDPKGNELIDFESLPHVPKPNGNSSTDAIELLQGGVDEMDRRYNLFRDIRVLSGRAAKDIIDYNNMISETSTLSLPRWLIILDEYSDLLDENPGNKSIIETLLKRLAQKARAAGIHVILATQKPLVNIVSSAIKSNLPGVIALRVRTAVDSRVILDDNGAETLAGRGDSLFKNGTGQMVRVQCAIYKN